MNHEKPNRRKGPRRAQDAAGNDGRVAAWSGEIDVSAPPLAVMVDDCPLRLLCRPPCRSSYRLWRASFFGPPLSPARQGRNNKKTAERFRARDDDVSTDKPNPRSFGFALISSLRGSGSGGNVSPSPKLSLRRSSSIDVPTHQPPKTTTIGKGASRCHGCRAVTRPSPSPISPSSPPPPEPNSEPV